MLSLLFSIAFTCWGVTMLNIAIAWIEVVEKSQKKGQKGNTAMYKRVIYTAMFVLSAGVFACLFVIGSAQLAGGVVLLGLIFIAMVFYFGGKKLGGMLRGGKPKDANATEMSMDVMVDSTAMMVGKVRTGWGWKGIGQREDPCDSRSSTFNCPYSCTHTSLSYQRWVFAGLPLHPHVRNDVHHVHQRQCLAVDDRNRGWHAIASLHNTLGDQVHQVRMRENCRYATPPNQNKLPPHTLTYITTHPLPQSLTPGSAEEGRWQKQD